MLLTARPLRVRPQTLAWLDRYKLRWDLLIMRDYGDYSASRSFKRDAVDDLRAFGFDLRLAFEDDRRNVDMFHAAGHPLHLHPLGLLRIGRPTREPPLHPGPPPATRPVISTTASQLMPQPHPLAMASGSVSMVRRRYPAHRLLSGFSQRSRVPCVP